MKMRSSGTKAQKHKGTKFKARATCPPCLRASVPQCLSPSGFSLTEVMFAVIVMGIGFIMVAAMFPVTISQSRLTVEETTAAALGRNAFAATSLTAQGGDLVTPGPLLPATDLLVA